jgi:hypothetical protein
MNRKDKFIEILNPNSALTTIGLSGQISKQSDRFSQSTILSMHKSGKLQIPSSTRHSLNIQIPNLTFQVFLPSCKSFAIELSFFDNVKTRRKILLSSFHSISKNSVQSKLPIFNLPKETWLNLCIDIASLSSFCFSYCFEELDSISVTGACKVRRIFSCLNNFGDLPSGYQLPVSSQNVLINSHFFEEVFGAKKAFDENFKSDVKKMEGRGLSANNRSACNISGRYCALSFRKQLRPIEKSDSFYENAFNNISGKRKSTPPFVHLNKESLFYDPVSKAYVN